MALTLLQSAHAMAAGQLTLPFGATGGTEPYAYSVEPGGAGGTINPSTGVYTSPASGSGEDTIVVTDADMSTDSGIINICTPLQLVCDIIQTSMGLSAGQVYIYNNKINIPVDSALYVAVGVIASRPFGNRPRFDGSGSGLDAIQSVNVLDTISIDILSRSQEALNRKEHVLMALTSPYAQQQMAFNSFFVAPLPQGFVNLSAVDGAAIPYRFNISCNLQYFSTLTTPTDYFDTFSQPVVTPEA
jgi:hypothetical protein